MLSDIAVGSLGALEALAILKQRDIDVPFLIVSETSARKRRSAR